MEQLVESNSVEKFKVIASGAHTLSTLQIFFKKEESSKPGHGNLFLITSDWTLNVDLQLIFFKF